MRLLELQGERHIAKHIRDPRLRDLLTLRAIEVRPEIQRAYNAWVEGRNAETIWASGCKSWYVDERGKNTTLWPGFASAFRARTSIFRARDYVES